jgi:hypothetical protein
VPYEIFLSNVSAAQGFVLTSANAQENLGFSLSSAGDVNGDGIDDLLLGTNVGDAGSANAPKAYVIYGRAGSERGAVSLGNLNAADGFVIQGRANQNSAEISVSAAGDVNGDGLDDLILGASFGTVARAAAARPM